MSDGEMACRADEPMAQDEFENILGANQRSLDQLGFFIREINEAITKGDKYVS